MLSKLASYTLVGIDATPVEVEVDVSFATMPKTVLVGLAETAVKESTHRVERAIVNSGYRRPIDRVVINLAPADLKKDAGGFDLPIPGQLLSVGTIGVSAFSDIRSQMEPLSSDEGRQLRKCEAGCRASRLRGKINLVVAEDRFVCVSLRLFFVEDGDRCADASNSVSRS